MVVRSFIIALRLISTNAIVYSDVPVCSLLVRLVTLFALYVFFVAVFAVVSSVVGFSIAFFVRDDFALYVAVCAGTVGRGCVAVVVVVVFVIFAWF